jgi:hypothetical protein
VKKVEAVVVRTDCTKSPIPCASGHRCAAFIKAAVEALFTFAKGDVFGDARLN